MARNIGKEREKSLPMGYPRARRERRLPPPKPYSMRELRRYGRKAGAETITGPWDLEDGSIVEVGSGVPTHRDGKLWFDPAAGPQVQAPEGHGPTHEDGGSDPVDVKDLPDSQGRLLTGTQKMDLTDGGFTDLHIHEEAHVHVYKEDKSGECDGAKTTFITAHQFEPYSLRVMLNGLEKVDGAAEDYEEGAVYDSFVMAVAPGGGDNLIAHYLVQRV